MCQGCYEEAGSPTAWTDTTARAADLIQTIYRHHSAGGLLHIVLDDWNLEDEHVQWAEGHVAEEAAEWREDEPEMVAACEELAPLLTAMSEEERASTLAYAHGIAPRPGATSLDPR